MQAYNSKNIFLSLFGLVILFSVVWLASCKGLGPDEISDDILVTDETGREIGGDHSDWCKDGVSNGNRPPSIHINAGYRMPAAIDSLELSQDSNKVNISWITTYESNCKRYNLERRTGGSSIWDTVKKVNCSGGALITAHYNLTDTLTAYGSYYYRIRQIDSSLSSTVYEVLGYAYLTIGIIISPPSTYSFGAAYPNPTSDFTNVRFNLPASTHVRIYFDNDAEVMNENKPAGTYEVRINKSSYGFSNEVVRIYMEAGDFHCHGDIQFR
jgi:hypothetical protein